MVLVASDWRGGGEGGTLRAGKNEAYPSTQLVKMGLGAPPG